MATVGYRLVTANATRCRKHAAATGLLLHDLSGYALPDRGAAALRYGLGDGVGILGVVPGSPGDQAQLRAGDEIIGVEGVALGTPASPDRPVASFDRVQGFMDRLEVALERGPARLTIRHGGQAARVNLAPVAGCAAQFTMVQEASPEAWSDERYVAVSDALVAGATDDELAFVMGHELAHIVLGHRARTPRERIPTTKASAKQRERDADMLGLTFATAAGFDGHAAVTFLLRLKAQSAGKVSFSHPSFDSRIAALEAALGAGHSAPAAGD